jgi:hypothetical protein
VGLELWRMIQEAVSEGIAGRVWLADLHVQCAFVLFRVEFDVFRRTFKRISGLSQISSSCDTWNWGSSVSIVSDYRLDDWGSIPGRGYDFSSSLCVQTSSEAHPASCPVGTAGSIPGVKRGWVVMLTTHPHLAPRSGTSRSYTSLPP